MLISSLMIHVTFDGDRCTKQEIVDVMFTETDVRRGSFFRRTPVPGAHRWIRKVRPVLRVKARKARIGAM